MALTDILFPDGDSQNFIQTMSRGNIGTINDYLTEADSNSGILVGEWTSTTTETTAYTWVS